MTLDAPTLRRAMSLYARALEAHQEELDSLNVFPVPDGDTGTNLLLTQRAVEEACAGLDGATLLEVGETAARAALLGARGNAGVILSQILRGLGDGLREGDLVVALTRAEEEGRRAVAEPKEGTILSVLGAAASAARGAEGGSAAEVARAALAAAREALAGTTGQLEELRRAGVVDAGGKGLVLLLDAVAAAIEDRPLSEEVGPLGPVGREGASTGWGDGFEVMYVLHEPGPGIERLRERLTALGDSVVVGGDEDLVRVHVHTDRPGSAVEEGIRIGGRPEEIRIVSLHERVAARRGMETSIVAVAEGKGLVALLESLGAAVVAASELDEAIERALSQRVVVLPNDAILIPAAEAAATRSSKQVSVVPTASVAQGVAAASAYLEDDPDPVAAMEAAASAVRWGEVPAEERDPAAAAVAIVRLHAHEAELVTLYLGERATDPEAVDVATAVREAFPSLEVEVHRGDQPRAAYLVAVE